MRRVLALLATSLLVVGCGGGNELGSNAPPTEFMAGCLLLPQGSVVSWERTPTLDEVVRTMDVKEGISVSWEKVSDNSYIQRMVGSDPLTGKKTSVGMMFTRHSTQLGNGCPDGTVILERMIVNDEELNKTAMNVVFVSMVNVEALNGPPPTQPEPLIPPVPTPSLAPGYEVQPQNQTEEEFASGPRSDLDVCLEYATSDAERIACYDDEISATVAIARREQSEGIVGAPTNAEIDALTSSFESQCTQSTELSRKQCQQRLGQQFNIRMIDRRGS